jgi:hypothetical protein
LEEISEFTEQERLGFSEVKKSSDTVRERTFRVESFVGARISEDLELLKKREIVEFFVRFPEFMIAETIGMMVSLDGTTLVIRIRITTHTISERNMRFNTRMHSLRRSFLTTNRSDNFGTEFVFNQRERLSKINLLSEEKM